MRVVLDANVIIAAFAARGLCADLFELALSRNTVVTSASLLQEVRRGLPAKIKAPPALADEIESLLVQHCVKVEPAAVPRSACRDPKDLMVLGTAVAGGAAALVTGDRDLLSLASFRGIPILDPRGFWDMLSAGGVWPPGMGRG